MESEINLLNVIQEKEKEDKIVFMTIEGPMVVDLEEFIKQPTEGILYDLNRDKATVITFMREGNPKWINDYAVGLVIAKLKSKWETSLTSASPETREKEGDDGH